MTTVIREGFLFYEYFIFSCPDKARRAAGYLQETGSACGKRVEQSRKKNLKGRERIKREGGYAVLDSALREGCFAFSLSLSTHSSTHVPRRACERVAVPVAKVSLSVSNSG